MNKQGTGKQVITLNREFEMDYEEAMKVLNDQSKNCAMILQLNGIISERQLRRLNKKIDKKY